MPNRIIRESARTSPTLDQLSANAERLFWRLITVADDHGRFDADPRVVMATAFPLKVGRLRPATVGGWLQELASVGTVQLYEVEGRRFGAFCAWGKHQRSPQGRSKHPTPPTVEAPCPHGDGTVSQVLLRESRIENRESRDEKGGAPTVPPVALFTFWGKALPVSAQDLTDWTGAFVPIDVLEEIRRLEVWASVNRRTYRDPRRFVVRNLARAQRSVPKPAVPPSKVRPAILDEPDLTPAQVEANQRAMRELVSTLASTLPRVPS